MHYFRPIYLYRKAFIALQNIFTTFQSVLPHSSMCLPRIRIFSNQFTVWQNHFTAWQNILSLKWNSTIFSQAAKILSVITSTTLSSMETFSRLSFPHVTHSRTKWHRTLMCFDALWSDSLLEQQRLGCHWGLPKSNLDPIAETLPLVYQTIKLPYLHPMQPYTLLL